MKWKALLPVEIIGKASQTGISQPQNLQHPEATRPFPRPEPHTSLHFRGTAGAPADLQSTWSLTVDVCARGTRCPRGNVFSRADARGSGEGRPGDDLCVPPPGARQELALRPPHLAASAGSHPSWPSNSRCHARACVRRSDRSARSWAKLEQTRYRSPRHHDLQTYFLPPTPQVSNFREPAG